MAKRILKRDVQAWADKHLPGWKAQANDDRNGWELSNPKTGTWLGFEYAKEVIESARR